MGEGTELTRGKNGAYPWKERSLLAKRTELTHGKNGAYSRKERVFPDLSEGQADGKVECEVAA